MLNLEIDPLEAHYLCFLCWIRLCIFWDTMYVSVCVCVHNVHRENVLKLSKGRNIHSYPNPLDRRCLLSQMLSFCVLFSWKCKKWWVISTYLREGKETYVLFQLWEIILFIPSSMVALLFITFKDAIFLIDQQQEWRKMGSPCLC